MLAYSCCRAVQPIASLPVSASCMCYGLHAVYSHHNSDFASCKGLINSTLTSMNFVFKFVSSYSCCDRFPWHLQITVLSFFQYQLYSIWNFQLLICYRWNHGVVVEDAVPHNKSPLLNLNITSFFAFLVVSLFHVMYLNTRSCYALQVQSDNRSTCSLWFVLSVLYSVVFACVCGIKI